MSGCRQTPIAYSEFLGFTTKNTKSPPLQKVHTLSPGAPPAPVRLSGQKIFEEKFSPFQWTGRWKFATNGGSWQHFYRRLNASKSARIESREDSKTLTVAEIGKNGVFFVKRARCNPRFSHFGCPSTLRGLEHPCITKSSRAFHWRSSRG